MHASRFIATLAGALALGAAAAEAQTSPAPVMTMAPAPASTDVPATTGPVQSAPPVETAPPLGPVKTMAPRPMPGGPGGAAGGPGGPGGPAGPGGAMAPGSPALNARSLQARRTATGYVLAGQAEVKDGCQAARFDPSRLTIYPPQFDLVQYRNPANRGVMCMQVVRWVPASRSVTSVKPPPFVTVRTAAGTKRVTIR